MGFEEVKKTASRGPHEEFGKEMNGQNKTKRKSMASAESTNTTGRINE